MSRVILFSLDKAKLAGPNSFHRNPFHLNWPKQIEIFNNLKKYTIGPLSPLSGSLSFNFLAPSYKNHN